MNKLFVFAVIQLAVFLFCPAGTAQTFSYDGNRWYEIEVSIFSNERKTATSELVIPEKVDLTYLKPIRQLTPASSSFMIDFDQGNINGDSADSEHTENLNARPARSARPAIGPEPKRPASEFRITDFARDPYITLGESEAEFSSYNSRLDQSGDHRLLFHAVWRQPLLNRNQATALFVAGGEQFGAHQELEGSLRFSYDVNRVDVEARIWLMTFGVPFPGRQFDWQVPARPYPVPTSGAFPGAARDLNFGVESLYPMQQERAMISNELHYLDNPALGMLVEIRPYQLPEPSGFEFE